MNSRRKRNKKTAKAKERGGTAGQRCRVTGNRNEHNKKIAKVKEEEKGTVGRQQGTVWVVKTVYRIESGGRKVEIPEKGKAEQVMIEVGQFATEPARVSCQKGLTMNIGNYESARVDVGFSCPCYPEEIAEVYDFLNQQVELRLQAEVLEVRGKDIRPGYEEKRQAEQQPAHVCEPVGGSANV